MSPRTSQPPEGDATKDKQYRLRMSPVESATLEYCCKALGLTKAEVIRQGIVKVYQDAKAQKEK